MFCNAGVEVNLSIFSIKDFLTFEIHDILLSNNTSLTFSCMLSYTIMREGMNDNIF